MAPAYRTSAVAGGTSGSTNPAVVITPAVGDLFVVFCVATTVVTGGETCTDNNGGTYSLVGVGVAEYAGSTCALICFVRNQLLANTTSTTVTISPGTNTSAEACVVAISGCARAGVAAIRQSAVQQNQAASTTPAPVFTNACLTTSLTLGAIGNNTNPATMTPPTSWTERQDVGQNTPAIGLEVVSRDSGFTGTTITWGSTSGSTFASFIVEVISALGVEDDPYFPQQVVVTTANPTALAQAALASQWEERWPHTAKTFYFLNVASNVVNTNIGLLEEGSPPPVVTMTQTGWNIIAQGSNVYAAAEWNSVSFVWGTTPQPTARLSLPAFGNSNPLTGIFDAGTWTISVKVTELNQDYDGTGHITWRIWRTSNIQGTGEMYEITSGIISTNDVSALTVGSSTVLTVNVSVPNPVAFVGHYLILALGFEQTVGNVNSSQLRFVQDGANSFVTTPPFTDGALASADEDALPYAWPSFPPTVLVAVTDQNEEWPRTPPAKIRATAINGTSSPPCTCSIAAQAGDLLVLVHASGSSSTVATDSAGGTYFVVQLSGSSFGNSIDHRIFVRTSLVASTGTITVTVTGNDTSASVLAVVAVSGMYRAGFDAVHRYGTGPFNTGGSHDTSNNTPPTFSYAVATLATNPCIVGLATDSNVAPSNLPPDGFALFQKLGVNSVFGSHGLAVGARDGGLVVGGGATLSWTGTAFAWVDGAVELDSTVPIEEQDVIPTGPPPGPPLPQLPPPHADEWPTPIFVDDEVALLPSWATPPPILVSVSDDDLPVTAVVVTAVEDDEPPAMPVVAVATVAQIASDDDVLEIRIEDDNRPVGTTPIVPVTVSPPVATDDEVLELGFEDDSRIAGMIVPISAAPSLVSDDELLELRLDDDNRPVSTIQITPIATVPATATDDEVMEILVEDDNRPVGTTPVLPITATPPVTTDDDVMELGYEDDNVLAGTVVPISTAPPLTSDDEPLEINVEDPDPPPIVVWPIPAPQTIASDDDVMELGYEDDNVIAGTIIPIAAAPPITSDDEPLEINVEDPDPPPVVVWPIPAPQTIASDDDVMELGFEDDNVLAGTIVPIAAAPSLTSDDEPLEINVEDPDPPPIVVWPIPAPQTIASDDDVMELGYEDDNVFAGTVVPIAAAPPLTSDDEPLEINVEDPDPPPIVVWPIPAPQTIASDDDVMELGFEDDSVLAGMIVPIAAAPSLTSDDEPLELSYEDDNVLAGTIVPIAAAPALTSDDEPLEINVEDPDPPPVVVWPLQSAQMVVSEDEPAAITVEDDATAPTLLVWPMSIAGPFTGDDESLTPILDDDAAALPVVWVIVAIPQTASGDEEAGLAAFEDASTFALTVWTVTPPTLTIGDDGDAQLAVAIEDEPSLIVRPFCQALVVQHVVSDDGEVLVALSGEIIIRTGRTWVVSLGGETIIIV